MGALRQRIRLALKVAVGAVAFLTYVWFAAVRNAARAKRSKAAKRAARRARK